MKRRTIWYKRALYIALLMSIFLIQGTFQSAQAGSSWFSKARQVEPYTISAAGDIGTTVFDLVISLYNNPTGDDDPNNDTGSEQQTNYEEIIRFWADAICEESNQALKLGKVRIFRNGTHGALADVVWNANEGPRGHVSGFGVSGKHITFGDVFPDGCGTGCNINYLNNTRHDAGGYTLGHEFGHYVLGLYDEYRGDVASDPWIGWPLSGDTPVWQSIMNNQWNATTLGGRDATNDLSWLNHSTSNNYQANTAQGRCYGESCWDVMIQEVGDDPKDGQRSSLPQRVRYTALVGNEPTAADNWIHLELPAAQADCRNQLQIIWMQNDIEMQIVIDRSGTMTGDPLANAKQAAKTLVDEAQNGNTSLGVVSFSDSAEQSQPIVNIPDPPGTVKSDIKTVIDNLAVINLTAMFDASKLALDNLISFAATNSTNAAQLVFLLSDGLDNNSTETQQSVTTAYQNADIPLNTFAYGDFAPDGVLRQLAEDTGGLFRASPTDLAEIQSAFLSAKAALTESAAVLQETKTVSASSETNFSFAVDETLKEMSIFANYVGGSGDIDFLLEGPSSTPVGGVTFACTEVSGATSCSAVVNEATVTAIGPGEWSLIATNNTTTPVDISVDILANPLPVRTYDLIVASLGGTEVIYPAPLLVTATVSQDYAITDVNIVATITNPSGDVSSITLTDTGENGDAIACDGTYSAIVDYTMNGTYTIKVKVDNSVLTAQFTNEGLAPAYAPAPNEEGNPPPPPVFPPVLENFTRTASLQVMVSGVVPDDHPDTAPGTLVLPDNSDVDGRIEESGDVDVFTVPTAGFEMLTFRVTGLAQGMAPRLRIFKQDGITEIMSATIDQLVEDAPYVAVYVPVNGDSELHAEVSHAANGTGIYQFSAGKPIFSDPPKQVDIDIKPASCPNPMRLKCNGVLPAAILGTEAFDVTTINPETIMITRAGLQNGVPLIRNSYEDVGTPFGGTLCDCHALGKDGYTDVSLKFMVSAVVEGLRLYELADRDTVALRIVGKTYNGTPLRGEDCILVLGELRKECNSDLDCDADVDGTDAAMFKAEYGRRNCNKNNPCFGDFTSDGDVDGTDVFTFRSEFGTIFR